MPERHEFRLMVKNDQSYDIYCPPCLIFPMGNDMVSTKKLEPLKLLFRNLSQAAV